jgi:hypothetical protein
MTLPPLRARPAQALPVLRPGWASVAQHRAAKDQPVTYSVGCQEEPNRFAQTPHRDDCLGPQSD